MEGKSFTQHSAFLQEFYQLHEIARKIARHFFQIYLFLS